jgi:hypothetical protein
VGGKVGGHMLAPPPPLLLGGTEKSGRRVLRACEKALFQAAVS